MNIYKIVFCFNYILIICILYAITFFLNLFILLSFLFS